jgi:cellulose synthase/poly-beta-1,6-N-acetylglucosamine synthase-like glycosyltransferase
MVRALLLAPVLAFAFAVVVADAHASPDGHRAAVDGGHSPMPGDAILASVTLPGQEGRFVGVWLPFGFLGLIAWSVWFVRRGLTALYRPIANDHSEPASVVAPAFREDPDVLERAVRSWLANGVSEVLLVLPEDEPDNLEHARAAFAGDPQVRILTTDDPAKRNSLTIGIEAATQPIIVLSDSDTLWEPDLLRNLLMPFADPQVGGVGSRQRVVDPDSSAWRRAADWMLDAKYLTYIPAMSRAGGVSCLSGRTVAYRREPLLRVLPDLKGETFWGRQCVSGDDGRLTWLILNLGLKTVYQQNAVAWTMMPDTARGFFMQRLRWSRNSYRCYLRAIVRGWLFRQPLITRVSVLQGLLAPLSLTVGFCFVGLAIARNDWLATAVWAGWITCGRGLRAFDHLRHNPRNLVLLPLMTALILFAMTAIKYYSFFTMNKQAWVTRRQDRGVAEGQSAASVAAIAPGSRQPVAVEA